MGEPPNSLLFRFLIFNFAFWRDVVSKSNAASSSSTPPAPLPRRPASQPASGVLPVRPSVRPSVRLPARSWQAWLPFGCCCCPSLQIYIYIFPSLDLPNNCCRVSQGCQIFHSSQTKTPPDCFCYYYFCWFVHSEYWTLTSL